MGWFDENAPAQQDWFSQNAPSDVPTLEPQVVSPAEDIGLSGRIKNFLFSPEGAQTTREAIQGAVEAVPHMAVDTAKMAYNALKFRLAGPDERARIMADVVRQAAGQGQQTAEDIQSPFGTREWLRGAGQLGMMATPGLELFRELRAPVEIPREIPPIEAPPVQPAPPPIPPEYAERRFTLQPEQPPQLAPSVPIEQTLPSIQEPLPFNPEAGPAPQPEFQMPVRTEFGRLPGAPEPQLAPPPPIGTPLKPAAPLLGEPGTTAADVAAQAVEVPVRQGEFAKPGYTAVETPPVAAPEPYTPEAAAARAAQPQLATEPVGGNVAGFEKVYGPGEIPAGETIGPEDAWDTASARAQSGKAQPYGFVDRARTGAITPEEMGDLIYEHHRLVERAAGLEGMPEYAEASQTAKDFASNVLKPAETAWHQKGMVMQIERPVNLNTFTGMDQLMQTELGRGIKPSEAPKFTRMAEDVKNGETEVTKAVERSDARVRTKYAKVRDIPIEEAVARVKQMLKDCM